MAPLLRGTDVSAYQDSIPSCDFCILKATEGISYTDPPFASRWHTLGARGTLRGAYHFARPDAHGAAAEADHFLSVVLAAGLKPGDLLVLDHEKPGGSASSDAAWARAWCSHVQAKTGIKPVVYTFLSFAWEGRCDGLGGYPLWIADPSRAAGQPRVPSPWKDWVLHQYGEPGGVDVDVFKGSRTDWLALGGLKPPPQPTPAPVEDDDMPFGQLTDGAQAITPISIPKGKYSAIGFLGDNGLQGKPPAKIRVAVHSAAHGWHVEHLVVDSTQPKTWISFPQSDTDGVSVQREDDGSVAVAWDAS